MARISQFVLELRPIITCIGADEMVSRFINSVLFPGRYVTYPMFGIQITEGRNFKPSDGDVYIFNEAARKKYPWMKVGELAAPDDHPIVGFCENIRYSSFRNNDEEIPMAFFIYGKNLENGMSTAS